MSVPRCLRRVAAAVLLGAALCGPAAAGELADRSKAAEALLADGKPVQALAEMEAAFNAAWDLAPLGFSEALFVAARPSGFGIYDARLTNIFKEGEDMLVYAEPYGFGYGRDGELFLIDFEADFELKTPTGQILHEQKAFADLKMKSRRRNKEFQVFITYNFSGLKPGDYVLTTRLHDLHSDKTGAFELPFTLMAAPRPGDPATPAPAPVTPAPAAPSTDAPVIDAPATEAPGPDAAPRLPEGEPRRGPDRQAGVAGERHRRWGRSARDRSGWRRCRRPHRAGVCRI
ncbi:hypothetical protein [Methylobrevis pamukkalensis]|uniref:Uncharacterized protein n=1 Tax=Methylobrevis pamukkalensis TaxID=1439726 RepID=A0A1E3H5Z2_9HYPH|nr:hypothetical protein [Methylobrevis pamukkalensis]ODN71724.1 hypothetical protein A6302_00968 [Methylobrevis pamukkalensis]